MAQVRFLKIACLLSNEKADLALHLSHHLLTGQGPCKHLHTTVAPSTIRKCNLLLAKVDKAILKESLSTTEHDIAIFADDSNKRGEDRHMVVTWSVKHACPVGYLLADTIVASGRGEDQAHAEYNVLSNVYGVKTVVGVVGDNASTQSGAKKGHAVELGNLFKARTVFIGCYPHIINIALRNGMAKAFGQRGQMTSFNLFQLQYKIGYVHHQKPSDYKALYVSKNILNKSPPLPQQFMETRWTYIHENLQWCTKYGDACLKLGKHILEFLPKSDVHYGIWEEIIQMSASPVLKAERTTLLEVLDRLIIPALRANQLPDTDLGFSSGYLARKWPAQVLHDLHMAKVMNIDPDFAMPLTAASLADLLPDRSQHYRQHVLKPLILAIIGSLEKHGARWFKFPLLFAMGANSSYRPFFWRVWLRVRGLPVDSNTDGLPWLPDSIDRNTLYRELLSVATSLKCPFTLAAVCHLNGLLDRQKHLLQDSSCYWFREFEVLALVSADVSGMTDWMAKWPMPDGMAAEITDLAKKA